MDHFSESQELLRLQIDAIQEATVDGVFTLGEDGSMLSFNAAACNMFGYEAAEMLNKPVGMLMPLEVRAIENAHLKEHGTSSVTGMTEGTLDRIGLRKDNTFFPFRLNVRATITSEEKYYICVLHDLSIYRKSRDRIMALHKQLSEKNESLADAVSQRSIELEKSIKDLVTANNRLALESREREVIAKSLQRKEIQLEQLLDKERELSELRSRFISMASHEFRTPLTTMLSSVEIIEMAVSEAPAVLYKHTHRIREGIGYLRNVLEDFLQLGKLDVKGTKLQIKELNLKDLFVRITEDLNMMCKPGQDIEITIDNNIRNSFHSKNGLRICVTNLLTNAIKYSGEGSAIDFEVTKHGDQLWLTVKDEGIGIPNGEDSYLFERFFRASNSEAEKGTGLGLHIAERYARAMNGVLEFKSLQGIGTTFTLKVPFVLSGVENVVY